jgi:hypothetical protein
MRPASNAIFSTAEMNVSLIGVAVKMRKMIISKPVVWRGCRNHACRIRLSKLRQSSAGFFLELPARSHRQWLGKSGEEIRPRIRDPHDKSRLFALCKYVKSFLIGDYNCQILSYCISDWHRANPRSSINALVGLIDQRNVRSTNASKKKMRRRLRI